MQSVLKRFYKRYLNHPGAMLIIAAIAFLLLSEILASVFTALVIAFILEWGVKKLERWKFSRGVAVGIVFTAFIGLLALSLFILLPLLWQQTIHLATEIPHMLSHWEEELLLLPANYPGLFSEEQVKNATNTIMVSVTQWGQHMLAYSTAVVPITSTLVVYLILVPMMIFFMLKDRDQMIKWFSRFLPKNHHALARVWDEIYVQLGNYVRGKVAEMVIVGFIAWVFFVAMGLNYAALLAVVVGVSILVPYVGAVVASIPLLFVGLFQWGFGSHFVYLMLGYGILHLFDGNILFPLLFSKVVRLHPLAIIVAIIFFGALWGFWGIFFAIPLAIMIKAVINAWPEPAA